MSAEARSRLSAQLLALACVIAVLATVWSVRTAPVPNADRYDYLGRAHHVLEGMGPRPLFVYPLRLHFDGAAQLPPTNLTRPPLWPTLIAPALRLGAGDAAGVITSAVGLLALLGLVWLAADRSFGAPAGGVAAIAIASSFATTRALHGGGPELWLALLLMLAWTWNASGDGRADRLVLGGVLGLLPWLHPIGWFYAAVGLVARIWRSQPARLAFIALVAVVVGVSWYARVGQTTESFLGPLQSQAELAKSVFDAGGLGPYRTLEPRSSLDVLTENPVRVLRHAAHDLRELVLHLDGWLAWPFVLLALLGIGRDRALALRDGLLVALAFGVVSFVATDPRLLVPLLPVAATWSGAGAASLLDRFGRAPLFATVCAFAILPWVLPLGATPSPPRGVDHARTLPSAATVRAVGTAGEPFTPMICDSGVLVWKTRRPAVFLPDRPRTLERLLAKPALAEASVLVLAQGTDSRWLAPHEEEWAAWIAGRRQKTLADGTLVVALTEATEEATHVGFVPEPLALSATDAPDSLLEVPSPIATRAGLRLDPGARRSLLAMAAAARADGVELRIVSAYRSYARQRELYESAVRRHGPDQEWVAAPGASEHQLGVTVDFCDAAMKHVLEPSFAATAEGRWLAENAARFGWIRSYTEANAPITGYRPEPWHYRWYPELATEDDAP